MNERPRKKRFPSFVTWSLLFVAFLALAVLLTINVYRPDRPLPRIEPGSSTEPTFRVQIIRPRESLPLGGLIPPQVFGVDAKLGFDSAEEGATYTLAHDHLELLAGDWDLRLYFDGNGRIEPESEVVFDLIFEDQVRRVRCHPRNPAADTLEIAELEESGEFSGWFRVELSECQDAETGETLGWPPKPMLLQGSFDRLTKNQPAG